MNQLKTHIFASLKPNLKTWLGIFSVMVSVALFNGCAPTSGGAGTDKDDPFRGQIEKSEKALKDAFEHVGKAEKAYQAAKNAGENKALVQTKSDPYENAKEMAMQAYEDARDERDKVIDAVEAVKNAPDLRSALDKLSEAETARDAALEDLENAIRYSETAVEAAKELLMIDGDMYEVGDKTVDATAPNTVVETTTGGQTLRTNTGLQEDLEPTQTVQAITGVEFTANTDPTPDVQYVQAVATDTVSIGKVVDSVEDDARLMIVDHYAGSNEVKVFAYNQGEQAVGSTTGGQVSTSISQIITDLGNDNAIGGENGAADTTKPLRTVGTFYLAGTERQSDGLTYDDVVAAGAEPVPVYSYVSTEDNPATPNTDETVRTYLVLAHTRTKAGGPTVYVYRTVDITAEASDETTDGTAEEARVTAEIPDANTYKHIHFGVWADLKGSGNAQTIDGLGIGFVQSIRDGMTADDDMPDQGGAEYKGNWAATVQAADPDGNGTVTMEHGVATLTADFAEGDVMVHLVGLAMLEGAITGGTFSGVDATVGTNSRNLTPGANFTGKFSGGFFGTSAREAGGVFSFTSDDDNEDGAFSGAFGGRRR